MLKLLLASLFGATALSAGAYLMFRPKEQRTSDLTSINTAAEQIWAKVKTYCSELSRPAPVTSQQENA